jgi:hypothetical protein
LFTAVCTFTLRFSESVLCSCVVSACMLHAMKCGHLYDYRSNVKVHCINRKSR